MDELERAREQRNKLCQRLKQARAALADAPDSRERRTQAERVRLLGEMYREACREVRRLDPGRAQSPAPKGKKGKNPPSRLDSALACGAVWADLEGTAWAGLEGMAWDRLPQAATGRQARLVQELVHAAAAACTPLQERYLHAYYAQELTLEEIGARFGVDASTVSRTLRRARQRMGNLIRARLLLGRCVDGQGRFDYMLFLHSVQLLTERQKEMVYLLLCPDASCRDIARFIGRTPSTVKRTAGRVEEKLDGLAVTLDAHWSAVRVARRDWAGRSEKELAEDLGLSPAFYYRVVRRGERLDGLPLLTCAILNRLAAGESPGQAARALGCSQTLVKRARRAWDGSAPPPAPEPYHPRTPRRVRLPENPFAALPGSGDALIDRIDAATYRALQARFGGESHAGT